MRLQKYKLDASRPALQMALSQVTTLNKPEKKLSYIETVINFDNKHHETEA